MLAALALLVGVLLSVAGLFVTGQRQVHRARQQSAALAAARTILEEIGAWSHAGIWTRFDSTGDVATLVAVSTDTNPDSVVSKWQPLLRDELPDARAEIRIESWDGAHLNAAAAVRVVVTVAWNDPPRTRSTTLALVRS